MVWLRGTSFPDALWPGCTMALEALLVWGQHDRIVPAPHTQSRGALARPPSLHRGPPPGLDPMSMINFVNAWGQ
ncbi:uncharacterized protein TrAtP1_003547 [Trichoderma atroviride]|uniref:uncharacterized protein n=1 Tax=Hypocrea atroviridis TaxID=63577 RepID=UPI0033253020|nr:hypothetical protein TrAtP1_003547 [Trichoderma atroviride]